MDVYWGSTVETFRIAVWHDWLALLDLAGQRMCICHLPCRQMKSSQGLDQVSVQSDLSEPCPIFNGMKIVRRSVQRSQKSVFSNVCMFSRARPGWWHTTIVWCAPSPLPEKQTWSATSSGTSTKARPKPVIQALQMHLLRNLVRKLSFFFWASWRKTEN